jgi:hypothetical protein
MAAAHAGDQCRQTQNGQSADNQVMQVMFAEFADRLHPFAIIASVTKRTPAGMPFLVHLMAETPPGLAPGIAITTVAEVFHLRLGLVVFIDREILPNADTNFAHEISSVDFRML